ncbi:MAG: cytochrome P460 family protein [Thermodesulfovibrionales bacterium]|nr:cytochrome P460 family protein [Thermodesulfovibrionales bacterium]
MKKLSLLIGVIFILVSTISFAEMGSKEPSLPKDWRSFIHAKSMVIPDKSHDLYGFHHIYVNKTGLETLKKGGKYPQGTIFIGVFYDVVTEKDNSIHQGKKLFYVYMKKDKAATETGGWTYAVFDPNGKYLKKDVKTECYACHSTVKDSDYIFTKFIE